MDLSIIIPSLNEGHNIRILSEKIRAILDPLSIPYEIWIIDDSTDNTPCILEKISHDIPNFHYIHRKNTRGLSSAILEGFRQSVGQYIIVMDGDLQHPPELFVDMYHALLENNDIVIPSRFMQGGSDGGLNFFRKLISWTARRIGQISIPQLRDVSDCTSGYFGLKRSVIDNVDLHPYSWKILIEILVKGHVQTIHEIPYHFVARRFGESKLRLIEQWNYLRHIVKLVFMKKSVL